MPMCCVFVDGFNSFRDAGISGKTEMNGLQGENRRRHLMPGIDGYCVHSKPENLCFLHDPSRIAHVS